MIKIDKGIVQICGDLKDILADISTIVHNLHYECLVDKANIPQEESRKMIMNAVELGLKKREDVEKEVKESKERMKSEALKALDELRSILLGKDEE